MPLDLRTVRNVELIRCGTWNISTGPWTVTPEHLRSAIAAHEAGALRKAILKIGHEDPRFDGSPALGHLDNLRLTDNGQTLSGDFVGVPTRLASVLASAYPDRSIEGIHEFTAADGTTFPFVLTAVALLGATAPGIDTLRSLQDVTDLYGIAAKRITLPVKAAGRQTDPHSRIVTIAAARRRRAYREDI